MKIKNVTLKDNISPTGEYFKTLNYLRSLAEAARSCKCVSDSKDAVLLDSELKKYNALNINNGTGRYVIVL